MPCWNIEIQLEQSVSYYLHIMRERGGGGETMIIGFAVPNHLSITGQFHKNVGLVVEVEQISSPYNEKEGMVNCI